MNAQDQAPPADDPVVETAPLGFPWVTIDPFLFCVHHADRYPAGNDRLGPAASLAGRNLGMDFEGKDGWRMYHGQTVPGFPQHPHRGFETITVTRVGLVDHSDSLGATARFGQGDVQWMTAGRGIVHAEMFPLLDEEAENPLDFFQIWLNLPAADKMVEPHFKMLWASEIQTVEHVDDAGRASRVRVVAGRFGDAEGPGAPPHSWAAREEADVALWTIDLDDGASLVLPPCKPGSHRTLYFYQGDALRLACAPDPGSGRTIDAHRAIVVRPDVDVTLQASGATRLLVLQGRPIGEPVAHHGPFVMNSGEELRQAIMDYQRTRFGGWPWPSDAPVHDRTEGRFAVHPDGSRQTAPKG